jgi:glutathione S-transferase/autophagy-related protein 2
LEVGLNDIENVFLSATPFIYADSPSIADISCFEELAQMDLLLPEYDWNSHPVLREWRMKMKQLPHHDEVHAVLEKVRAAGKKKAQEQAKM